MKYKINDIVLVRSTAGDEIPNIHVKLLERVVVKERKGRQIGMRKTMDWPGYSGWEATPVSQDECDRLRSEWSIPLTKPGEDITFIHDYCIIKRVKKLPEIKKYQPEKISKRRKVRNFNQKKSGK